MSAAYCDQNSKSHYLIKLCGYIILRLLLSKILCPKVITLQAFNVLTTLIFSKVLLNISVPQISNLMTIFETDSLDQVNRSQQFFLFGNWKIKLFFRKFSTELQFTKLLFWRRLKHCILWCEANCDKMSSQVTESKIDEFITITGKSELIT